MTKTTSSTRTLSILFAVAEMAPWVKTGGLGDVAAALPEALRQAGQDVRVLLPCYPALRAAFPQAQPLSELSSLAPMLPPARLLSATTASGLPLLLLDCPALYAHHGSPYVDTYGHDRPDNAIRFGLLSRVAALLGQPGTPLDWQADIVHVHDWHTALAPAYLHYEGGAASVITVHNMAFAGCFAPQYLQGLGLPAHAWRFDGVEFHGQLSFLKAGLQWATRLSTVSPSYAREIQSEAWGYGFAPVLRYRASALRGILNGIDTQLWNPATDPALAQRYGPDTLELKAHNKAALQQEAGLRVAPERVLLGVVSRFTHQKGLDLLLAVADRLAQIDAQLVVLGAGDAATQAQFEALAQRHAGRIAVRVGFDEGWAHRIEAGADCFVMPSRFEPCGLNQMYSLRYGTPPIVRATGGLADTVTDASPAAIDQDKANGFVFAGESPQELWATLERAHRAWQNPPLWRQLQQNGMRQNHAWPQAAQAYIRLYQEAVQARLTQP